MEFVEDGKGGRIQIPDSVIAAADNRDLVEEYVKASPADRVHIEKMAIDATTPKEAQQHASAPAAPAQPVRNDVEEE